MTRFNRWLATTVTNAVSTMWCAYLFAGIALVSLPSAIHGGTSTLIAWIAQTFLQLVLLSIIMVGQKQQAEKTDAIVESHAHTHHLILALHRHHGIPPESE